MGHLNIAKGAWVVVSDGGKALIFENSGSPAAVKLNTREVREHTGAPMHQQGTDQPGRVYQSFGSARSAVGQADWHDEVERDFLGYFAGDEACPTFQPC
jgi:protein required for attachment to host cells